MRPIYLCRSRIVLTIILTAACVSTSSRHGALAVPHNIESDDYENQDKSSHGGPGFSIADIKRRIANLYDHGSNPSNEERRVDAELSSMLALPEEKAIEEDDLEDGAVQNNEEHSKAKGRVESLSHVVSAENHGDEDYGSYHQGSVVTRNLSSHATSPPTKSNQLVSASRTASPSWNGHALSLQTLI